MIEWDEIEACLRTVDEMISRVDALVGMPTVEERKYADDVVSHMLTSRCHCWNAYATARRAKEAQRDRIGAGVSDE